MFFRRFLGSGFRSDGIVLGGGVVLLAILGMLSVVHRERPRNIALVSFGSEHFSLEVADTPVLHQRGLGGRTELPERGGMLFLFGELGARTFWMKDMKMPIDIIWLAGSRIIGVEHTVPAPPSGIPDEELPRYHSPEPADRVIELAAGRTEELGLRVGQTVEIQLP
ncbi:MAG: DUF192 domain-containing protein [Patescibacteria group bacterium]